LSPDKRLLARISPKAEEWLNAIDPGKKPLESIRVKKAGNFWSAGR